FKPSGNPQDILAKQSELARKAFDAAIQNTNEIAELVKKTNADAFNTLAGRITESVNEMRGSLERGGGGTKEKS
ncbi:MAG TPA: TIGR01841 family phasin, partial [Galbitalea sp.]|nr:TIGR01841 family phasin [Galbitalea sp.]